MISAHLFGVCQQFAARVHARANKDELYIEVVALALLATDFYFECRVVVVVVVVACVPLITPVY